MCVYVSVYVSLCVSVCVSVCMCVGPFCLVTADRFLFLFIAYRQNAYVFIAINVKIKEILSC